MILYFGNALSCHGKSVSVVETLGPKLALRYPIKYGSSVLNPVLRLCHMVGMLLINRKKAKVVLIDTYSSLGFYYALILSLLCRFFGIPYIPILHGGHLRSRLEKNPKKSSWLFGKSHINVSPSLFLLETFRSFGFEVEYIPNSIEIGGLDFKVRTKLLPKLFWVRSFQQETYNPFMAVYTLKKLVALYPKATLCMVGGGDSHTQNQIQQWIKQNDLEENFSATGALSRKQWQALSVDYDVFINTTNYDNHPISIIEAMALGFPIVSTDVGGLPYLIKNNADGLLVGCNDSDAMVSAILKLLHDPGLATKLSNQARRKAESFSWNHVEHKWYKLLDSFGLD